MDAAQSRGVTWHVEVLPRTVRQALRRLAGARWLKRSKWYLAGGTALALQAGHRASVDLDFFTPQKTFSADQLLAHFPKESWTADVVREGTVYGRLLGTRVSFIAYPYFVARAPYRWYGSVRVLAPADIAVMKIVAISQRGRKRDFVDLYWYCRHREPLGDIVERLRDQYPTVAHNYHHIIKSLAYFADAEAEPMPKLFFDVTWKDIKKFFEREVSAVARRKLLGLR
ncbi:nucleotidyl transferase AbiEii/AbiGii toxin family protein [Candidatus Parcubacteria bacterium]|nr:nucleotidyl transferase AbiEii/AbiGii toxin family protein [Candidatus Parcubacteria bacterium]